MAVSRDLVQMVERARALTEDEIRTLGSAADRASGFFGADRKWGGAKSAARVAAEAVGSTDAVRRASNDVTAAIFDAAIDAAEQRGRNVKAVRIERAAYLRVVERGDASSRERARALSRLDRASRKALGRDLSRRLGPALLGASAASAALVTWKLAGRNQAYTLEQRSLLMQPWERVAGLTTPEA